MLELEGYISHFTGVLGQKGRLEPDFGNLYDRHGEKVQEYIRDMTWAASWEDVSGGGDGG